MEILVLIIPLFVIIAIIGMIHSHRVKQARIAELTAWAQSRGLQFEEDKFRNFDDRHPDISCLHSGENRYAYNIVSGKRGEHFMIAFDYHYETTSTDSDGDSSTTHYHFSAVMLQPKHRLKPLLVRREGFFDKIKAGFGFKDINFESAAFSKRYFVTAPEKRWAYDVLNTRTMELILAQPRDYTIEFDHEVICIAADKTLDAFWLEKIYDFGAKILDGIPEFAQQDR